jgi:hypothetical protein
MSAIESRDVAVMTGFSYLEAIQSQIQKGMEI